MRYEEIVSAIEAVPGVVAHGLVVRRGIIGVIHTPTGPKVMQQVRACSACMHGC